MLNKFEKCNMLSYSLVRIMFLGEKYLGCWSGNMKSGSGLIVTIDGIYYEGTFSQDVLTVSKLFFPTYIL